MCPNLWQSLQHFYQYYSYPNYNFSVDLKSDVYSCQCYWKHFVELFNFKIVIFPKLSIFYKFQVTPDVCSHNVIWPSRLFGSIFGVFLICVQFIGPLVILIYCYGRIVWILTRKIDSNLDNKERNATSTESVLSKRFSAARNNTIKTVLLVGICFIVCWVNDEVYYLLHNLGYKADWNSPYFKFCMIMVFLNCTVNPFVYLIKYQDYQKALKEFLGFKDKELQEKSHSTASTTVSNIQ